MQLDVPIVGILRGIEGDFFDLVMETSFLHGLQAIELTMNTPGALDIVSGVRHKVPAGKFLGMGTIRNLDEAKMAFDAGAMFFVTPNLDVSVIEFAQKQAIPIIAGALTPSEVYTAWRAGADMIKVFPSQALGGPTYIRELRGPYDDIPLMAVGGVDADNMVEYFKAGVNGVGIGTQLFGRDAMATENIDQLGENVKKFVDLCALMH